MVSRTMKYMMAMTYNWVSGWWIALAECKVTFMKGCVPEGRCRLAGIGSRTNHQRVSGYWEQSAEMLVWLGENVLGCPQGILFCDRL